MDTGKTVTAEDDGTIKSEENKSHKNNNFEDYESPEGTSVMTSTFEGNTL